MTQTMRDLSPSISISSERLVTRIFEDAQRDPLDAERDAEIAYETLCQLRDLLEDPGTSFRLSARLQEDLASKDRETVVNDALMLLRESRRRSAEALNKVLSHYQNQAEAFHRSKGEKVNLC